MPVHPLKAVCKNAARVLGHVTAELSLGESRKLDNAPGTFMALCVECIEQTTLGPVFSLAHYYEQNGDLVPDPDVTVLRSVDGAWYPLSFQNALAYRRAVEIDTDGTIRVNSREQADLAQFMNIFTRNIREQQRLDVP